MLTVPTHPSAHEKQTMTTQIRHGQELGSLIDRATIALGVEKSFFVRTVLAQAAEEVLRQQSYHALTDEDADLFARALDMPPQPTDRAVKAARLYQKRVVHAD